MTAGLVFACGFFLGAVLALFSLVILYVLYFQGVADKLSVPTSKPRSQHRHKGGWASHFKRNK